MVYSSGFVMWFVIVIRGSVIGDRGATRRMVLLSIRSLIALLRLRNAALSLTLN